VEPADYLRNAALSFGASDAHKSPADAQCGGYAVIADYAGRPGLLDGRVAAPQQTVRAILLGQRAANGGVGDMH
jgi:hypothetical protein